MGANAKDFLSDRMMYPDRSDFFKQHEGVWISIISGNEAQGEIVPFSPRSEEEWNEYHVSQRNVPTYHGNKQLPNHSPQERWI